MGKDLIRVSRSNKILVSLLVFILFAASAAAFAAATTPAQPETKAANPAEAAIAQTMGTGAAGTPQMAPGAPSAPATANTETRKSFVDELPKETQESLLATAQWLIAHKDKVVLIDARPKVLYDGGHIPGAVNADWTYFANMKPLPGAPGYGDVWPEHTMGQRLGALGVNGQKQVVVYDDAGGWGQSGWVVWILRMSGVKNAKILDGGLTAWKKAGGKPTLTAHKATPVAFKIAKYQEGYNVTTKWILDNIDHIKIVDVRTPPEFEGAIKPFQEKRAGHLPGAINMPMQEVLDADGLIKSADDLEKLFAGYGLSKDQAIVVYDTAGVRSSFVTMILRLAGFNSRNYDASFHEWSGNAEYPIETGK